MHRRDIIRKLLPGRFAARDLSREDVPQPETPLALHTQTGAVFYAKGEGSAEANLCKDLTLPQGWRVQNGELQCPFSPENQAVLLAGSCFGEEKSITATLVFRFLNPSAESTAEAQFAGLRLGLKTAENVKDAAGIAVGVTRSGSLFIGSTFAKRKIEEETLTENIHLSLTLIQQASGPVFAKLRALDSAGNTLVTASTSDYSATDWQGPVALVSHCAATEINAQGAALAVSRFEIQAAKAEANRPQPAEVSEASQTAQHTTAGSVAGMPSTGAPAAHHFLSSK